MGASSLSSPLWAAAAHRTPPSRARSIAMSAMQSRDSKPAPTRRDFLRLATTGLLSAAGLVGLAELLRFLDFESPAPPKKVFDVGAASQYPTGSRTYLPDVPAMLLSTESGF